MSEFDALRRQPLPPRSDDDGPRTYVVTAKIRVWYEHDQIGAAKVIVEGILRRTMAQLERDVARLVGSSVDIEGVCELTLSARTPDRRWS